MRWTQKRSPHGPNEALPKLSIVTRERHTRVTESSNSCFLRYITSVFNNPALWDFSVDTFGLSRITHAGRFTHSRRKKWVFTNSRMKFLLFTHHAWMSFHEFTQQKKGFHDFTQRKKAFHAITQPYGGASFAPPQWRIHHKNARNFKAFTSLQWPWISDLKQLFIKEAPP